jgi:hypothetical protein
MFIVFHNRKAYLPISCVFTLKQTKSSSASEFVFPLSSSCQKFNINEHTLPKKIPESWLDFWIPGFAKKKKRNFDQERGNGLHTQLSHFRFLMHFLNDLRTNFRKKKTTRHFKILRLRKVTQRNFHIQNPKIFGTTVKN